MPITSVLETSKPLIGRPWGSFWHSGTDFGDPGLPGRLHRRPFAARVVLGRAFCGLGVSWGSLWVILVTFNSFLCQSGSLGYGPLFECLLDRETRLKPQINTDGKVLIPLLLANFQIKDRRSTASLLCLLDV